jgi:hypothetical protein
MLRMGVLLHQLQACGSGRQPAQYPIRTLAVAVVAAPLSPASGFAPDTTPARLVENQAHAGLLHTGCSGAAPNKSVPPQ